MLNVLKQTPYDQKLLTRERAASLERTTVAMDEYRRDQAAQELALATQQEAEVVVSEHLLAAHATAEIPQPEHVA